MPESLTTRRPPVRIPVRTGEVSTDRKKSWAASIGIPSNLILGLFCSYHTSWTERRCSRRSQPIKPQVSAPSISTSGVR